MDDSEAIIVNRMQEGYKRIVELDKIRATSAKTRENLERGIRDDLIRLVRAGDEDEIELSIY